MSEESDNPSPPPESSGSPQPPEPSEASNGPDSPELRVVQAVSQTLRTRLIQGLLVILPVAITIIIVSWVGGYLWHGLIRPVAYFLAEQHQGVDIEQVPWWYRNVVAPTLVVVILLSLVYLSGMFVRSRLRQLVDFLFNRVPLVNTVYKAVRGVFDTIELQQQMKEQRFQRVVLIEFPHPGLKCPAFVTNNTHDARTGQVILCVYVPTTPLPTSGYMLMVPEKDVVEIEWDLNETLQAVISGGMAVPRTVHYWRDAPPALAGQGSGDPPKLPDGTTPSEQEP